jgi:ATP-binding cassette subfamily F protein 3
MEDLERRKLLGAFGLTGDQQLQTVGSLSGGQRCRAALAKLAAEEANVLILDEPTNHLDLWARAALEKAICDFEGTVLFISHDRYFVDHVADHLLIMQPDGRFKKLEGNYTTYRYMVSRGLMADPFQVQRAECREQSVESKTQRTGSEKKNAESENSSALCSAIKPKRKFPYRKISDLEQEIADHESMAEALEAMMLLPETLRDGSRVREITRELDELRLKLRQLYDHWDEASELN